MTQALLRPGRFDRQISIDRPDITGREQIFRVYLEKIKLDKPIKHYSERMAALTPGACFTHKHATHMPWKILALRALRLFNCTACLHLWPAAKLGS